MPVRIRDAEPIPAIAPRSSCRVSSSVRSVSSADSARSDERPDPLLVLRIATRSSSTEVLARITKPARRKALAAICHPPDSPHVSIRATQPYVIAIAAAMVSLRAHVGSSSSRMRMATTTAPSTAAAIISMGKDSSERWSRASRSRPV